MAGSDLVLSWKQYEIFLVNETEVDLSDIEKLEGRLVYVIETPKSTAIRYANGISNVCYIGRQGERVTGRRVRGYAKTWMSRHLVFSQSSESFVVHVCHPRRRNSVDVYKSIEGLLLAVFKEKFGDYPIFNRKGEDYSGNFSVQIESGLFEKNRRTKFSIDFSEGRRKNTAID